ncbi:MAG: hypothetical protein R3F61_30670 [Myxococcota bacterium]
MSIGMVCVLLLGCTKAPTAEETGVSPATADTSVAPDRASVVLEGTSESRLGSAFATWNDQLLVGAPGIGDFPGSVLRVDATHSSHTLATGDSLGTTGLGTAIVFSSGELYVESNAPAFYRWQADALVLAAMEPLGNVGDLDGDGLNDRILPQTSGEVLVFWGSGAPPSVIEHPPPVNGGPVRVSGFALEGTTVFLSFTELDADGLGLYRIADATEDIDLSMHDPWLPNESTIWPLGDVDSDGAPEYLTAEGGLYTDSDGLPTLVLGMDRRVRSVAVVGDELFIMDEDAVLSHYPDPMGGLLRGDAAGAWHRPEGRTSTSERLYGFRLVAWDADGNGAPEIYFSDPADSTTTGVAHGALFVVDPSP